MYNNSEQNLNPDLAVFSLLYHGGGITQVKTSMLIKCMIDHAVWPSNSGNPLIGEKLID